MIFDNQLQKSLLLFGKNNCGELLDHFNPTAKTRFRRLVSSLNGLMQNIHKDFPDARYYLAGDRFCLMLGKTHSDQGDHFGQPENVADERTLHFSSGGDW